MYQKHCIQKRFVWAEFPYFSWYHGFRSAFFSFNYYSESWACNNIIMMLSVRSFAAVYIQRIIAHNFFLGKSCFLYRLVSVRFFTIDSPRNLTLYIKFRYNWWFVVRIWLKSRLTVALLRHSFKISLCTSNVSNFIVIILGVLIFIKINKFPYLSVSFKNYPMPFWLLCHFPCKVELVF